MTNIVYPEVSHEVTYEPELAVVIKSVCRNVTTKDAKQFILGYTCSNDVSARDIQEREMSLTRAKSFDTFCPTGPFIETEVDPFSTENIWASKRQRANCGVIWRLNISGIRTGQLCI